MRLKLCFLALCLVLASGCRVPNPIPTAKTTATPPPARQTQAAPAAAAATPAAVNAASTRAVVVGEVEKHVLHYPQLGADAAEPLYGGETLDRQGIVETGEESRARLDLLPEETLIRLGPSTRLQLTSLSQDETQQRVAIVFRPVVDHPQRRAVGGRNRDRQRLGTRQHDERRLCASKREDDCHLSGGTLPPGAPRPMTPEEVERWLQEAPEAALNAWPAFLSPLSDDGSDVVPVYTFRYDCSGRMPCPVHIEINGSNGFYYQTSLGQEETARVELERGVHYVVTLQFGQGESAQLEDTIDPYMEEIFVELCCAD